MEMLFCGTRQLVFVISSSSSEPLKLRLSDFERLAKSCNFCPHASKCGLSIYQKSLKRHERTGRVEDTGVQNVQQSRKN
jgi:hypothetical protein